MSLECEHCHSTILYKDAPRDSVCTVCGSSINLESEAMTIWHSHQSPKRLGKFEFLERLGMGAFGAVYKAQDTELDRLVAIKIPRTDNLPRLDDMERFLREAKSTARLKHPGIVSLYDAGLIEGTCCLVSEFIQGINLAQRLVAKRFTPQEAAENIAEIADALHYAHQQGIIHRDIKPSNIMLGPEGRTHLMDFGLAKRAADDIIMTLEGQVLGTPAYMSPEQAKGEVSRIDSRSDLYSLGVVLYELLTGEIPFRGESQMLLVQVIQDEPRPPRRINARIPRDLETICLKLMAKEPARRYQTALELAEDLRRFLKGEPIQARPVGQFERFSRWCRRNPEITTLVATIAILLVVGASVATYFAIDATVAQNRADLKAKEAENIARQLLLEKQRADIKALEAENNARQMLAEKNRADAKTQEAESHAAEAYANLYIVRLKTIQMAWENSDLSLARRDLLEQVRQSKPNQKDLRGWEWYLYQRLCNQDLLSFATGAQYVEGIAFSPDGKRLVTAGEQVKVWDVTTGKNLLTFKKQDWVDKVAFSPDGKQIASVGKNAIVWDSTTGKELFSLKKTGWFTDVAFSPDNTLLVTSNEDRKIRLWNAKTGKEIRTWSGHTDEVSAIAFCPDGKRIASASKDKTVRIWNVADGRELLKLQGHEGPVQSVAFRPDGRLLASGGANTEPVIKLWDTTTGEEWHTLKGHTDRINSVAFSPDGWRLVSASGDNTVKVWDPTLGVELHEYKGFINRVYSVAYSPDGNRLAIGAGDSTVSIWNILRGTEPQILKGHSNQVRSVGFTTDSQQLVSVGQDGKINLWDIASGQMKQPFSGPSMGLLGMAISPNSRYLATSGDPKEVAVWDLISGQSLWKVKAHPSWVSALAFSPDGKWLASGGARNPTNSKDPIVIKLWEASTGKLVREFQGHKEEIKGLAFTPDSTQLISGSDDSTIKVWDVETGKETKTLKGHNRSVHTIALHPDGNILASAGSDHMIKLWDLSKGKEIRTLRGHFNTVWSIAFHPTGTRLASASWDQTVRIWDVASGLELTTLKGHSDRVLGVAFSPDGNWLASAGGKDLTIRLWDARPLTPDLQSEREATALVEALFAKPLSKKDVLASIGCNKTFCEDQRSLIMSIADRFQEETDPKKYCDAAWRIIRHPYSNVFMNQYAVSQTKTACALDPNNSGHRLALGIAQYRLGRFQKDRYPEALETLNQCDPNHPMVLAFLAMTNHQLGQTEKSYTSLIRLREIMKQPQWANKEQATEFLREAEERIEKPWIRALP